MTSSGTASGTVRVWMTDEGWGVIDSPDLPGGCWFDAGVIEGADAHEILRAGQPVEVEWTAPGPDGHACRAVRVEARDDLQATPGG
jgi:cold shock CspA family protein